MKYHFSYTYRCVRRGTGQMDRRAEGERNVTGDEIVCRLQLLRLRRHEEMEIRSGSIRLGGKALPDEE